MVRITRVYTRSGDKGTSALADGARLPKSHLRFQVLGAIDTLNAQLGVVLAQLGPRQRTLRTIFQRLQNELFDAGADIATPLPKGKNISNQLRMHKSQVTQIESDIDRLNTKLAPLKSFILPGGSAAAAQIHMARTLARTAERLAWALHKSRGGRLNPVLLQYLNRISDVLFVAARATNRHGKADILWVPGQSRQTKPR